MEVWCSLLPQVIRTPTIARPHWMVVIYRCRSRLCIICLKYYPVIHFPVLSFSLLCGCIVNHILLSLLVSKSLYKYIFKNIRELKNNRSCDVKLNEDGIRTYAYVCVQCYWELHYMWAIHVWFLTTETGWCCTLLLIYG